MDKLIIYQSDMTFGEWLRQQLLEKRLNNADLARRVGVSPTHIGNLVRDYSPNTKSGKARPSEQLVTKIAKAFGVPEDEARVAAGYAPINAVVMQKPRNVPELLEAIESLGVSQILFAGGLEALAEMGEDDLNAILESLRDALEVSLHRRMRKKT